MPITQELKLYSYDANPDSSVKIPALLKRFQEIARDDLLTYGITYNMMRDVHQVFVLIKLKIEIKKKISIYDKLFLKTVPTKTIGVTFFRDFIITNDVDEICAVATSSWILMNYETRSIMRPSDIIAPIPEFPDESVDIPLSRRFVFSSSPISSKTNVRTVYLSNLDENNHLNNTETAAFAIDEVSDIILSDKDISSLEIHFNHESVLGNKISIKTDNYNDCSYIHAHNDDINSDAFECLISYKRKEF